MLSGLVTVVSALALLVHLRGALRAGRLAWVEELPPSPADGSPKPTLTLVVAARDEEVALASALDGWLSVPDVPERVVVVDDRSTDRTSAILRERAGCEPRLQYRRVEALPEGWLGKVHALSIGVAGAASDFLLFTDADVHIDPDLLRRVLALCERERLDHVTIIPRYVCRGFALRLAVTTATSVLVAGARAHRVGRSRRAFFGLGAFNLVRRTAFERTEGFTALRLRVLDDMALAEALARAGASARVLRSRGGVSVEWYPSLAAFSRGIEKVLLAGASFRPSLLLVQASLLQLLAAAPFYWLVPNLEMAAQTTSGLSLGALLLRAFRARKVEPGSELYVALEPFGLSFLCALMAKTALVGILRGRVRWRGTEYALAELRRGRTPATPRNRS